MRRLFSLWLCFGLVLLWWSQYPSQDLCPGHAQGSCLRDFRFCVKRYPWYPVIFSSVYESVACNTLELQLMHIWWWCWLAMWSLLMSCFWWKIFGCKIYYNSDCKSRKTREIEPVRVRLIVSHGTDKRKPTASSSQSRRIRSQGPKRERR